MIFTMIKTLFRNASTTIFGVIIITVFSFVLANSKICSIAVVNGIELIFGFLIPSLYFQIIISKIIYESEILRRLPFISPKVEIILLGFLGGYTVASLLTSEALKEGSITIEESNALGYSVLCGGPSLIIGGVGSKLLQSASLGLIIYISSVLSQTLFYIIISKPSKTKIITPRNIDLSNALVSSVNSATMAIIKLSGFVLLFSSISYIISNLFSTDISILGVDLQRIISYFFESTFALADIVTTRSKLALYLLVFFLNFGGLSLIFQIKSNLKDLSLTKLIFSKVIIGLLSVLICYILLKLFPITHTTSLAFTEISVFYSNAPASVFLLMFSCYVLFTSQKKKLPQIL